MYMKSVYVVMDLAMSMCRGAPICKITDILITDILAMIITNSDIDTILSIM